MQRGQDAAGIIIIDENKKVLLVRQTYGKKQWGAPGGMVDEGESAWDAARRELKEEVNVTVNDMELAGLYFQPHKNRYIYNFKTKFYEGQLDVDNKEIDQYGFYSIDELPSPISSFTVERLKDAVNSTKTIFRDEDIDTYKIL